jgi:hypothetical protein
MAFVWRSHFVTTTGTDTIKRTYLDVLRRIFRSGLSYSHNQSMPSPWNCCLILGTEMIHRGLCCHCARKSCPEG